MSPHHADQQGSADRGRGSTSTQTLVPRTVVDGPLEAGTLRLQVLPAVAVDIGLYNDGGYEWGIVHALCLGKSNGEQISQHAELQRWNEKLGADDRLVALIQIVAHIQAGLVQGKDFVQCGLWFFKGSALKSNHLVLRNFEEGAQVAGEGTEYGIQADSR